MHETSVDSGAVENEQATHKVENACIRLGQRRQVRRRAQGVRTGPSYANWVVVYFVLSVVQRQSYCAISRSSYTKADF